MKPKKEKYFFEYEREAKAKKETSKKPGSPKGTPGKAAGPAKAKEKPTSKTREMRGYIAPAKPKVKITIKGSTSASNLGKSLKPGAKKKSK